MYIYIYMLERFEEKQEDAQTKKTPVRMPQ